MTPNVSKLVERRLNDFKRRCGKDGDAALQLAYHAAIPVALNPELLHFLRINFFLDPSEQLSYTVEFEFLTSGLCHEIDAELYEIEPEIRSELLQKLMSREDAQQRIRDIATLLWQYVEYRSPWADRVELERAQQLTALNFLDPAKAQEWLDEAEANGSLGTGEREWFIAMRQEIEEISDISDDGSTLGDDVAQNLNNQAHLYESQGRYTEAESLYQQALELHRRLLGEEHPHLTSSLNNLAGVIAQQGDIERAIALWKQSLEISERIGDVGGKAATLNNMAQVIAQQGDIQGAIALWEQSLEIFERIGDVSGKATILSNRARVIAQQSDKGVDYTRLRDLLAAGKWKEADEETLAVMLKAAEREKEGWLDIESIENFPCTDLRTIDQLWVKYSNGRFGFSVQKRIWQSVGGNANADYETFEKFGDRVGWRRRRIKAMVQKEWLAYDEMNFSTQARAGHLPKKNYTGGHLPKKNYTGNVEDRDGSRWADAPDSIFTHKLTETELLEVEVREARIQTENAKRQREYEEWAKEKENRWKKTRENGHFSSLASRLVKCNL